MALSPVVLIRFAASSDIIGLPPPPARLKLKVASAPEFGAHLFIERDGALPCGAVVDWLLPIDPIRIVFSARGALRADLQGLPPAWEEMFRGLAVDAITVDPSGSASISVRGRRRVVAAFAQRLCSGNARFRMHSVTDAPPQTRLLTDAQDEALRAAVRTGYYLIPRPLSLRQLARHLDISSASLSERLRRAEARVLSRYVNEGNASPGDDRARFGEDDAFADVPEPEPDARSLERAP